MPGRTPTLTEKASGPSRPGKTKRAEAALQPPPSQRSVRSGWVPGRPWPSALLHRHPLRGGAVGPRVPPVAERQVTGHDHIHVPVLLALGDRLQVADRSVNPVRMLVGRGKVPDVPDAAADDL